MKILNLYAGLGGNRKLWEGHEITAVEYTEKIAAVYRSQNPLDTVIVGDAHQYLLDHYTEFDFIWSSPPCQSHTRFIRSGRNRKPKFPDMKLYEEILFLKYNFKGFYLVENVIPYYEPMLSPRKIGRHLFWANFVIPDFHIESPKGFIVKDDPESVQGLKDWLGIQYEGNIYYEKNHTPAQVLRNCVHPLLGQHILNCIPQ